MRTFESTFKNTILRLTSIFGAVLFAAWGFAGNLNTLETKELRWQQRLLYVNTNSKNAKQLIQAWQSEHPVALEERKLLVLHLKADGLWVTQQKQQIRFYSNQTIANAICQDCLILVGLDGGVKYRKPLNANNLDKLFELIDAMPMRQSELRRKTLSSNH